MAIKTTRDITYPKPEKTYPYLGVYGDPKKDSCWQIVLFLSLNTGVMVDSNDGINNKSSGGLYYNTWGENLYKPYTGSVTLSNA